MKSIVTMNVLLFTLIIFHPIAYAQVLTDTKIVKDSENKHQVNAPKNWKHLELNEEASIQIGNEGDETYFVLISESKDDFSGWNLEKHSRITLAQILVLVTFPKIEGPTYFEIGGDKAVQYKLTGGVAGLNLVYLHTTVESENYFNQLLAWTFKSRFSKNEKMLQDIVNSFKVIDDR